MHTIRPAAPRRVTWLERVAGAVVVAAIAGAVAALCALGVFVAWWAAL